MKFNIKKQEKPVVEKISVVKTVEKLFDYHARAGREIESIFLTIEEMEDLANEIASNDFDGFDNYWNVNVDGELDYRGVKIYTIVD